MIVVPGGWRLSASDLNNFIECEHLVWLESEVARGRIQPPTDPPDAMAELLVRKGRSHEAAFLVELEGREILVARVPYSPTEPQLAIRATTEAMRRGKPVIYQAVLEHEGWFGIADFLERVERPSDFGAWSYEVIDTKLGRHTKPYYLIQLSLYSDLIGRVQGSLPERMHVALGGGMRESFVCREYGPYFRALRDRLVEYLAANGTASSYPLPVDHCHFCRWTAECERRWTDDDHLSGVANIRHRQVVRLEGAGVRTIADLAALPADRHVPRIAPGTLVVLRDQARLQVEQRTSGQATYELLEPAAGRGFELLPAPSDGDVFFDMEGDPFVGGRGLEYLFGVESRDPDGLPKYRAWWGHDSAGERTAFEAFIDSIVERRCSDPNLHVYHYAHYEPTALKRLAGQYGTREAELDDLLRGQVFVDLYRVVRQGLRTSLPGYSIKDIEHFYMGPRKAAVTSADDSIVTYELWLESKDQALLDAIELYNAEDCRSTRLLRDWLLQRKAESMARYGEPPAPPPRPEEKAPSEERLREEAERAAVIAALTVGLGPDPEVLTGVDRSRWLLAQLVDYHQREARPAWWMFFARLEMTEDELLEDSESIAGLEPIPGIQARPAAKSWLHALRFPAQEHKLGAGSAVSDPATGASAGTIVELDGIAGTLVLKRGPSLSNVPLPPALIPGIPYVTTEQRKAIRRFAKDVIAHGMDGQGRYAALRDLLLGGPPRIEGIERGASLQGSHLDAESAWLIISRLDQSAIVVQGPPGSGKTYNGARLIVRLMRQGKTIGVTALSHRAIHNLLHEVESVARTESFTFRGLKKCGKDDDDSSFRSKLPEPFIANTTDNPDCMPAGCLLLAGTAWLFSRERMDQVLDYLFVDEAGQLSLADAIAVGTSARNLVFLGDPRQLPHVSQATHPEGASLSVLEHVLTGHDTVPPDRGLFLDQSWRMHPDVCRFISELAYENRLAPAPERERQRIDSPGLSGTGLRYLPVEHVGNSQRSEEEAAVISKEVERLLQGTSTDWTGKTRPLTLDDILVVTPYNAQVRTLIGALPWGAQVGTVDKFQGREAAVVFFSMATSSGDDLPRNLEFLFSRNRLNVAMSRARAMSVLVASPRLLQVSCRTPEQMRLVNGLCRFLELAEEMP